MATSPPPLSFSIGKRGQLLNRRDLTAKSVLTGDGKKPREEVSAARLAGHRALIYLLNMSDVVAETAMPTNKCVSALVKVHLPERLFSL